MRPSAMGNRRRMLSQKVCNEIVVGNSQGIPAGGGSRASAALTQQRMLVTRRWIVPMMALGWRCSACHAHRSSPRPRALSQASAPKGFQTRALSYAGDWVMRLIRRRGLPAF